MAFELKAAAVAMLIAFGITANLPEFVAGCVLAIAFCYLVFLFTPPASRISVWLTLLTGMLIAVMAAIVHPHLSWINWLPVQGVMAAAGLLSKFFVEAGISFGKSVGEEAAKLPGMILKKWAEMFNKGEDQ